MAALQRIKQGLRALFAFRQVVDYPLAERYLSNQQMSLFRQMSQSEQLHSLNVLRDVLVQNPQTPHDLAVAALLHDAGKARYSLAIWQKSLGVLIKKLTPRLFHRWSESDTINRWTSACVVMAHHPAWSAEDAQQAGTTETALWLIEHHADPLEQWQGHPCYNLLDRLKQADDTN